MTQNSPDGNPVIPEDCLPIVAPARPEGDEIVIHCACEEEFAHFTQTKFYKALCGMAERENRRLQIKIDPMMLTVTL